MRIGRDSRLLVLAYVALTIAAGFAIPFAPTWLAILLVVGGLTTLLIVVLRAVVGPAPQGATAEPRDGADGAGGAGRIGGSRMRDLSRLVYYAGMITLGGLVFRVGMGFTISDWLFLMALMLALAGCLGAGVLYRPRLLSELGVGWFVFACGGVVSSAGAVSPNESLGVVGRLAGTTLILFWLSAYVLRSVSHVRIAVAAWGVSTALAGLAGIAQLVVGPDVIPDAEVAWGRVSGTTGHFNTLGGLAAIALVPVVALALDAPRRRMRLVATLSAALTAVGLILSGSVGGFLAAVAAFVCWLALRGVSVRLVLAGVAVTGAFVLVGTTVLGGVDTQSPGERLQSVTDQSAVESGRGGSVFTRLEGYGAAFARIRSDPFVGVGLDEASSVEATGDKLAHNMFLNTWLSGGVLALVGLVIMLSGALRMGVRAVQQASDRSLAASLLAAYVGFLVDGLGEPILFVRYGWMPVALLAALRAQQIAAARRTAVVAPARSHLLVVPRAPARTAGQRV